MGKYNDTRLVTFKEDYTMKNGTVIYKANSQHAIHFKVVEKLEKEERTESSRHLSFLSVELLYN